MTVVTITVGGDPDDRDRLASDIDSMIRAKLFDRPRRRRMGLNWILGLLLPRCDSCGCLEGYHGLVDPRGVCIVRVCTRCAREWGSR